MITNNLPDGGPAFPLKVTDERRGEATAFFGMSLRDWFAGQALTAVVKQYAEANGGIGTDHLRKNCSIHAYRIADAMLAERQKERS